VVRVARARSADPASCGTLLATRAARVRAANRSRAAYVRTLITVPVTLAMPLVVRLGDLGSQPARAHAPRTFGLAPKPAYLAETVLRTSEFPLIAQYGFGGGAIVVAVIETLPKTPSVWSANPAV